MRHGSLFSGGGGFDLAADKMGWQNVFHCEKDRFCQKVLKHYWPEADSIDDIKAFDAKKYKGKIDILTGGFPCQPFSLAGKRQGTADDRYLWPDMLRVVRQIKPPFVVGENVYGLINWSEGLVFEQVQSDLEAEGYKSQRMYCQLQVSMLRIKDTGCGLSRTIRDMPPEGARKLIPTPLAMDGISATYAERLRADETADSAGNLTAYVKHNWRKLVPTPTAMDATGATARMRSTQVKQGSMHSVTLSRWALIVKGDANDPQLTGMTGQLNPRFVAEMMGFPQNWTELPFLSGKHNH